MATFNEVINNLGKNFTDIAKELASSDYGKKIYPGQQELINELNQTVANNIISGKNYLDKQARLGGAEALQILGGISLDDAKKVAGSISSKNLSGSIDSLRDEIIQAIPENKAKNVDNIIAAMKERATEHINAEPNMSTAASLMGKGEKYLRYPMAYFSNPDKQIRNTRIATAAGVYAGLAIGGRYLTGGTLTNDSYGKKDIAGIPFI